MPDNEPNQKFKDLDYLISRIGMPAVVCAGLIYLMAHEWGPFKRMVDWKLERSIRNERAIMQKLNIPIVLDSDDKGKP